MNEGKLSKDEVQKLALSLLGFVALLYVYFAFFLGPLNNGRATAERTMADLQAKLASSKTEMAKAQKLEREATSATTRFSALQALSPEGAPIAWFPPRMKTFFASHKIERPSIRLENTGTFTEPELQNWSRLTWQFDLPQTEFITVGKALAELENTEPLLSVMRLTMRAAGDNPQFQQVTLVASSTMVKR
jgi:hypothetical protein